MAKQLSMVNTIKGSLLEKFYPAGWDLKKIDRCCAMTSGELLTPGKSWNSNFRPVPVKDVAEMDARMGDAIADQIEETRRQERHLILILPVGPMGMYKRVIERIKQSATMCDHVTTFNMDEWSDVAGNTAPGDQPGGFEHAMTQALFKPLGKLSVPKEQRNFATRKNLPTYPSKIERLRDEGAKLVTVYGIGRVCHIAFWEPHMAADYPDLAKWKAQTHRVGVSLHPLTIEQNAITSFNSRFTAVPCFANTIGPGLFLKSDFCIGGADGAYPDQGQQWQGTSICITLQHGPSPWLPSTFMPTMPGRLFFLRALLGPLVPDSH
jgi:glucosamine-6-phosphate deaminase